MKGQRKLIAGCYCRLSDDDATDGVSISIETQEKILTDYCQSHNIEVYDIYKDDGFTGTNFNRPSFKRMMKDAEDKKINIIVVKDLSRFGRNYLQVGNYIGEIFPSMNVRFIAIGDDVDTLKGDTDYDLMLPIRNVFNEYYPADCSKKTKQAFISKAKNGEYIGAFAAYGYKKSLADKHVLEINEETAKNVQWIFKMASEQGFGYNKISRVLSDSKVLTPAAFRAQELNQKYEKDPYDWNLTSVYKILNDKTYLGYLISGRRRKASFKSKRIIRKDEEDWIVVPGVVPQIIDRELWDSAHEKLETRKRTSKSNFVNIFAGLIKCDKCGHALSIANASNKSNYFMCNTYKKKGVNVCSSHYILYDDLYNTVLEDINNMISLVKEDKEGFINKVVENINKELNDNSADYEAKIHELKKTIEDLERKFDRLYDDRFEGLISDRKFKELSSKCELEQREAEAQMEVLSKDRRETEKQSKRIYEFVNLIDEYDKIEKLDADILNRFIKSIVVGDRVKNGSKTEQKIKINYRFLAI